MARANEQSGFLAELATGSLYKRNQGRLVRQLTAIAVAILILVGCWRMSQTILSGYVDAIRIGIPTAIAVIGLWLTYRAVNYPPYADFLIAVESEMDKVSWADGPYLIRATVVVLATMLILGLVLWLYDIFWMQVFNFVGFLDLEALRPDE